MACALHVTSCGDTMNPDCRHPGGRAKPKDVVGQLEEPAEATGAAMLLGLTPDERSRIPDAAVQALRGHRCIMDERFAPGPP